MKNPNVFNLCVRRIKRNSFFRGVPFILFVLVACSPSNLQTVRKVQVIQPINGQACGYQIAPATFQTLDNLSEMRGRVGRVVTAKEALSSSNEDLLKFGIAFSPIDTQFQLDGDLAVPVDLSSLFTASLYYSIESAYLMFRSFDTKSDLALTIPNFAETTIIYNAKAKDVTGRERKEVYDNAEYRVQRMNDNSSPVKNYFLSYPNKDVKDIPLGLNAGVMAHEFSHMVFHHLFMEPGIQRSTLVSNRDGTRPTEHTLAAFDEGLADYFGFMLTRDPGFIQCSFPFENRNLSVAKEFTEEVVFRLEGSDESLFDPHEGGAVFASIQYKIGEELKSHETNATTLVRMMARLLDCPEVHVDGTTLGFDFADLAKCHLREYVDPAQQATVRSVYEKFLGFRYRGR